MVGVAVKVTLVPAQIAPAGLAAIVTDGTTAAVTHMVISFDVAVVGLAQASAEVITQMILLPFTKAAF